MLLLMLSHLHCYFWCASSKRASANMSTPAGNHTLTHNVDAASLCVRDAGWAAKKVLRSAGVTEKLFLPSY